MEESISLLSQIRETFACKETDIRTYSPITLAFLGDCIYDLVIRTVLVERCNRDANSLHKIKSAVVKADAQAEMIEALLPELTEEEAGMPKPRIPQKMHQWLLTGKRPGLRL